MATAASTLVTRVRRRVGDLEELDALTASVSAGGVQIDVGVPTSEYFVNERLEIEGELMRVTSKVDANTLGVRRGLYGSTAASHASGSGILKSPSWSTMEILDALNVGLDQMWPRLYREILDTSSIVPDGATEEFDVPVISDLGNVEIPRIHTIEIRLSGVIPYMVFTHWSIVEGGTATGAGVGSRIKFAYPPPSGAGMRVRGYAPFKHLASLTDTLDDQIPYQAEDLPVRWATAELLSTGEARRVRQDRGPIDQREQATRTGSSLQAANFQRQQFFAMRDELAMEPMRAHIVIKQ